MCTQMGISVLSQDKTLQRLISDYRENHRQMAGADSGLPTLTVREYSPEAFSESLIEWIVSDDQVSACTCPVVYQFIDFLLEVFKCC